MYHAGQVPRGQWASVDESEDAEVQGIFGQRRLPVGGGTVKQDGSGYEDDVVNRFSGLMGQNLFGSDDKDDEVTQTSTLNANVPAFTPEQYNYQQHATMMQQQQVALGQAEGSPLLARPPPVGQGENSVAWQDSVRAKHRTPGPQDNKRPGPSPPNPFRYGLGFNYPPGKTGLTPVNVPEEQPFGHPYGMAFMPVPMQAHMRGQEQYDHQDGFAPQPSLAEGSNRPIYIPQHNDSIGTNSGSAWYDHLPPGQGISTRPVESDKNSHLEYGTHEPGIMHPLNFDEGFLHMTDDMTAAGIGGQGSANLQPNSTGPIDFGFGGPTLNSYGGMGLPSMMPQDFAQLQQREQYAPQEYGMYNGTRFEEGKNHFNNMGPSSSQIGTNGGRPPGFSKSLDETSSSSNPGHSGFYSQQQQQQRSNSFSSSGDGKVEHGLSAQQQRSEQRQHHTFVQHGPAKIQTQRAARFANQPPQMQWHQPQYAQQQPQRFQQQQQQQHQQQHQQHASSIQQTAGTGNGSAQSGRTGQQGTKNAANYARVVAAATTPNVRQAAPIMDEYKQHHSPIHPQQPSRTLRSGGDFHERKEKRERGAAYGNRKTSTSIDSFASTLSKDSYSTRGANTEKKRQELEETPQTRSIFKDFYKNFRAKEKCSVEEAFIYAKECLVSKEIPEKIHWRILLEMADLAKRENRFNEARQLYQQVTDSQPFAHQGWLEFSKMEEECGRLFECREILHKGLEYCNFAEQLLTKAIKHEERMNNLQGARALLARLRNQSVDKAWRTILEGALLEARAGNIVVARKVFKYLMRHVQWFGPIYYEATKFEEKNEEFERAIAIVEQGLKEISRYGPLWFNAFRLYEKTETEEALRTVDGDPLSSSVNLLREEAGKDIDLFRMFGIRGGEFHTPKLSCQLLRTRGALQRAMHCISKELVWKVQHEVAETAVRGGGKDALQRARQAYVQSILRCPVNLRWKIWISGARTELAFHNIKKARSLLNRALGDVPSKSKAQVLLEWSRLEEYVGNIDEARGVLYRARQETRNEWKAWLEATLLEVRNGRPEDAIRAAEDALSVHSGTGRLWAILVQLKHLHGPDSQRLVYREALKAVPKSGEVWCEGSRLHLNPLSPYMNLDTAARYLQFAVRFTPQYGDSFIESLRLHLLLANFGSGAYLENRTSPIPEDHFRNAMENCCTEELERECVNADPNYGVLWFSCKRTVHATAREVLRTARKLLIAELTLYRYVYREAIIDSLKRKEENFAFPKERTKARTTPALANSENVWIVERLDENTPEGSREFANFSTGLLSVNWLGSHVSLLVDSQRRKFLFGSDQIVP